MIFLLLGTKLITLYPLNRGNFVGRNFLTSNAEIKNFQILQGVWFASSLSIESKHGRHQIYNEIEKGWLSEHANE